MKLFFCVFTNYLQLTRLRQLKAHTVQRQLEEVAVKQIELEQQSVKIGEFLNIFIKSVLKLADGECVSEASCTADEENFSDWSSWGSCSVSCGGGVSSRARFCLSDTCSGDTIETLRNCGQDDCPILAQFTCADLGGTCNGFVNSDWYDPATGDAVTVVESTKPDPDNSGQTLPVVTIDGVDSISYDITAGLNK